jgi:hypothetical protein
MDMMTLLQVWVIANVLLLTWRTLIVKNEDAHWFG